MPEVRRLRVAFVVASLDIGGSEQQLLSLAERLPRDRFAVEFVLLLRRGRLVERAERAGAHIHVHGFSRSLIQSARESWRFVRTMRRGHYDIVDAWLFHGYAITSLTRPVTRIPVLIAGRRSLSHHKHGFGRVERMLDRIARRSVDAIVANSDAVRA